MNMLCLAASVISISYAQPLCIHGHPAPRSHHVTYAGLAPRHGFQRDHLRSLGLGGLDVADNVRYQRCDRTGSYGRCESGPAALKDADEHMAEEKVCSGRWAVEDAISWLAGRWPVDAAHGY